VRENLDNLYDPELIGENRKNIVINVVEPENMGEN